MVRLRPEQVRTLRTHAQGLYIQHPREALFEAVQAVCGVQAQLSSAMMLALRARLSRLTMDEVEQAIQQRELVRTWTMRGTLHLMRSEDIRWLVALLSPAFIASGKGRRAQLGLDEATCAKGLKAIHDILHQDEPLIRGEIVEKLADEGLVLERRSQAPIHLIGLAALEGILCLGPDRENGESSYVLMDEWVEQQDAMPSRDVALAEFARRYLMGYGPATSKDFAAWSGLSLTDAKQAWEQLQKQDELTEVRTEDRILWLLASTSESLPEFSQSGDPVVRLVSAFDSYVLGYKDRAYVVPPEYQQEVYHGGQTVPVVLVDGLAAGVWRYKRQGNRLSIIVKPFTSFDAKIKQLIAEEAQDIGRFWEVSASVSYSTEPL